MRTKKPSDQQADPKKQKAILARVRRLAELVSALRRGENFSITRLTVLKSLCEDEQDAEAFLLHLARQAQANMLTSQRPSGLSEDTWERHLALASEALVLLEQRRQEADTSRSYDLLDRLRREQNEYKSIPFGVLRLLNDANLAVFEHALSARIDPTRAPREAYEAARLLADRYDPSYGTGLLPSSAQAVQIIAEFWSKRWGLEQVEPPSPRHRAKLFLLDELEEVEGEGDRLDDVLVALVVPLAGHELHRPGSRQRPAAQRRPIPVLLRRVQVSPVAGSDSLPSRVSRTRRSFCDGRVRTGAR